MIIIDEKQLKQYRDLVFEIRDIKRKLSKEKREVQDFVKGSSDEFPWGPKNFHIEGIYAEEVQRHSNRLTLLLENRLEIAQNLQCEILEWIRNIPDSKTRRIFTYRYIDEFTWQKIAILIGVQDESYPRKKIHDKYLKGPNWSE